MKLLEGKNALVTGASRGIGEAIVKKFASQGASVAFTFKSSAEIAEQLVQRCQEFGVTVKAYQSDASSYAEAETLTDNVLHDFNTIDILINNAGITKDNLLLRMTEAQWDEVINVNLKSVFNLTRHVSYAMLKQKSGSIINISSVVGITGNPGQANYAASKAGIIGFTKSIAQELGIRNIRSNAISPGFITTDMTKNLGDDAANSLIKNIPLNRLGSPDDVADTALFLASDMSKYITGQVISVCGGMNR